MKNNPLPRLDNSPEYRERILPHCRLKLGEIWVDPEGKHKVGCLDASSIEDVTKLNNDSPPSTLAIHDPPYNLIAFDKRSIHEYIDWSRTWIRNTYDVLENDASVYIWLGADQNDGFQPLADFMIMMRDEPFKSRSFITMRNQRGYGTQKNWMAIRQELLFYTKGNPPFNIEAEYTDIPRIVRGYYKEVNGEVTENLDRSKSQNIRAGNVWVDIQQVFYRMEENISGCYAQKPLKSIQRIIEASSAEHDTIIDFFSHSGSTLMAAELTNRKCLTMDIDPIFCEITIRRLEYYRKTGNTGTQNGHLFEGEF